MTTHDHIFEVVIIGSGGAGCAAAIEAVALTPNVLLLTKSRLVESRTSMAQGGIQAAFGENDTEQNHYEDTLKAGSYKANPDLVKILTSSARDTILWLESIGVRFDKEGDRFVLKQAAGLSAPRILSCGDTAGRGIVKALIEQVLELSIPCKENTSVLNLKKIGNLFELSVFELDTGNNNLLKAKAVILATGGALPAEKKAGMTAIDPSVDGLVLAKDLGAHVVHPDLMQYHPTGILFPRELRRKPLPETMRGCGAVLLNKDRQEFVDSLLPRNDLTQAIIQECKKGNGVQVEDVQGVWLDTPRIDLVNGSGYTAANFPAVYAGFLEQGHDLTKAPALVYPILHYTLGGVEIDVNCESTVKGFFAAGETTWGVHGMDRLMGNSLLDIFVFGRIAGKRAALYAQQLE